jgi:putative FmdB family regulatory protein
MPRYDFRCTQCGETFEIPMHMEDRHNPPPCEKCGGKLIRSWSTPNVIYADEGFTQYKGRNGAGEAIVERKE